MSDPVSTAVWAKLAVRSASYFLRQGERSLLFIILQKMGVTIKGPVTTEALSDIIRVLQALPSHHSRLIKMIVIVPKLDGKCKVHGYTYSSAKGIIYFDAADIPPFHQNSLMTSVAHEIGHNVMNRVWMRDPSNSAILYRMFLDYTEMIREGRFEELPTMKARFHAFKDTAKCLLMSSGEGAVAFWAHPLWNAFNEYVAELYTSKVLFPKQAAEMASPTVQKHLEQINHLLTRGSQRPYPLSFPEREKLFHADIQHDLETWGPPSENYRKLLDDMTSKPKMTTQERMNYQRRYTDLDYTIRALDVIRSQK